ncbi:MAG: hypothetical protein LBV17_03225 [Treponema sp.]|jgi:hypothetical protein|nr:hypothetical protein [Treponema sp.]
MKSKFIELIKTIKSSFGQSDKKTVFYIQDINYQIRDNIIDGLFDYTKIDLKRLINGEIICYGIEKENNFVEMSYFDNKYIFRIYKNGIEEEIIVNEAKDIKKYFDELLNDKEH